MRQPLADLRVSPQTQTPDWERLAARRDGADAPSAEPPTPARGRTDVATCSTCSGRGFLVHRDGGAGRATRCPDCRPKRRDPQQRLADAGLPPRYARCRLDNFQTSHRDPARRQQLIRALENSRRYVDAFWNARERRMRASGLLFVGPPGVGKSHLASAVLQMVIQRYGVRGRFVDFTELVYRIQSTFDPRVPESKAEVLDPVIETDLLVLDELGAQKPTPFVMETLHLIINTRYTRRRPTLFTSNYRLDPPPTAGATPARRAMASGRDRAGALDDRGAAHDDALDPVAL
ncbi:MAG: ATP-binding protein, partial [Acidobacteriota bacterium]